MFDGLSTGLLAAAAATGAVHHPVCHRPARGEPDSEVDQTRIDRRRRLCPGRKVQVHEANVAENSEKLAATIRRVDSLEGKSENTTQQAGENAEDETPLARFHDFSNSRFRLAKVLAAQSALAGKP